MGDGLDTVIAGLKEGDTVAFEYTEKAVEGDATAKQLTLTKIQKTEAATDGNQNGRAGQAVGGERTKTQTFDLTLEGKRKSRLRH